MRQIADRRSKQSRLIANLPIPVHLGSADGLALGTADKPLPNRNDLLVKVHSFALNRMDIMQRDGKYPVPPGASPILGVEFAGVVEAAGDGVTKAKVGDRICGLLSGGCYAEYVLVPEDLAIPIPDNVSFEKAAAFPEAQFTAYQALFWINDLKEGEDVLIHAGASGVGLAAIQLAKWKRAGRIIATAGTASKLKHCKEHGATHAINYKEESFKEKINEITEGKGVNCIVDFIGATYWNDNIASLGRDGRMVLLGFLGGMKLDQFDLSPLLLKRLKIEGSTLRSRSEEYTARLRTAVVKDVLPMLASGALDVRICKIFPWTEIVDAHK
ncbi:NADPH:quinone reductase [Powellomyces hirtus]|nr:NADPH:quinone reductase [Powellomyces hirtus]